MQKSVPAWRCNICSAGDMVFYIINCCLNIHKMLECDKHSTSTKQLLNLSPCIAVVSVVVIILLLS